MRVLVVDCSQINTLNSSPHLGLAYIAAHIRELVEEVKIEGFFVDIAKFDCLEDFWSAEESFYNRIEENAHKYDIIMMSPTYATFPRVTALAKRVKTISPKLNVILGGPHISFLIQSEFDFLEKQCGAFDFLVEGEGEKSVRELVIQIQRGVTVEVPGVTVKIGERLKRGLPAQLISDLDTLEEPSWDLFPLEMHAGYLRVLASRGCVYNCTFCDTKKQWPGFRFRSAENVYMELKKNLSLYNIDTFRMVDPTFTAYPKVMELCQLIIDNQLEIFFAAYAHVKTVNREKLDRLHRAGCKALYYGIESGSNLILNGISKNSNREEIVKAIKMTKESGIKAAGSFILGLPGDTVETMRQTIDFAKELECDIYSWHSYMPSLFDIVKDDNVREYFDWKNLHLDFPKQLIDEVLENSQYEYLLDRHMITRYCQYGQKPIESFPRNYQDSPPFNDVIQAMTAALNETSLNKSSIIDAVESLESFIESEKRR